MAETVCLALSRPIVYLLSEASLRRAWCQATQAVAGSACEIFAIRDPRAMVPGFAAMGVLSWAISPGAPRGPKTGITDGNPDASGQPKRQPAAWYVSAGTRCPLSSGTPRGYKLWCPDVSR